MGAKKGKIGLVVFAVLVSCMTISFAEDAVSVNTADITSTNAPSGMNYGWEFTISEDITVTRLGLLDLDGDGLTGSGYPYYTGHDIGLWRLDVPPTLLAIAEGLIGDVGELLNAHRYVDIGDVTLAARDESENPVTYFIGAWSPPASWDHTAIWPATAATANSPVSIGAQKWESGAGLAVPSANTAELNHHGVNFQFEVVPEDPVVMIGDLVDTVTAMNLQQGIDNSLDAKLDAALGALEDANQNNDASAVNKLQAFINEVEAQRDNKITNEQADELHDAAQAIIDLLNGS